MQGQTLTVIVPAFNEEKTIKASLTRLSECLGNSKIEFRIILVIDGSSDDTYKLAKELQLGNLQIIDLPRNKGKGHAVRIGFKAVNSSDFVGFIDADLDIHPQGLLVGLSELQQNPKLSAVVGSKFHPDSSVQYPKLRKLQSQIFRIFVQALFRFDFQDTQTGLKIFERTALEEVLELLSVDGFAFDLEILARLNRNGKRIKEIPVQLDYQFRSTVNIKSAATSFVDVLEVYRKVKSTHFIRSSRV